MNYKLDGFDECECCKREGDKSKWGRGKRKLTRQKKAREKRKWGGVFDHSQLTGPPHPHNCLILPPPGQKKGRVSLQHLRCWIRCRFGLQQTRTLDILAAVRSSFVPHTAKKTNKHKAQQHIICNIDKKRIIIIKKQHKKQVLSRLRTMDPHFTQGDYREVVWTNSNSCIYPPPPPRPDTQPATNVPLPSVTARHEIDSLNAWAINQNKTGGYGTLLQVIYHCFSNKI